MAQSTKVTHQTAAHYTWGDLCDGWHFLKTDSLSIIKEKMPPGTVEQFHYHQEAQQFFYILSSEATFEVEGEIIKAGPHEGVHILAGQKHQIRNESELDLDFLVISEPKAHGDRVNLD